MPSSPQTWEERPPHHTSAIMVYEPPEMVNASSVDVGISNVLNYGGQVPLIDTQELPSSLQTSTKPPQKEAVKVQHVPSSPLKCSWMYGSPYIDLLDRKKLRSEGQYQFNPHLPIRSVLLANFYEFVKDKTRTYTQRLHFYTTKYQPDIMAIDPRPNFLMDNIDWPEDLIQMYASGNGG
ncbi:hypothetical protein ACOSQ3_014268 [Xanthoceras sorbifolium]